jgi:multidrug efflux pump subunit AcrA (membrane-fusion protein)
MLSRIVTQVQGEPVVVVPRDSVLLRRDTRVVLVRKEGRFLERRPVKVGPNIGQNLAILSGVQEGEEVVSSGAVLLDGELDKLL